MKEELKQLINEKQLQHFKATGDRTASFGIGMHNALVNPELLRHADPEIMKQAGWVREDEIRRRLDIIMSEPNGQVRETMISNLLI